MNPTYVKPAGILALGLLTMTAGQLALAQESGDSHQHDHEHSHDHDHDHDHDHSHDHDSDIHAGYFDDSQVKDRALSDWEGDWQSVYPYLQDGTLDPVMAHKAEKSDEKTAEEFKQYYQRGYKTDVDRIEIDGQTVVFHEDGETMSGEYAYDGYEILTYAAGNRGVRYIFELEEGGDELPDYIQFSDHSIFPTDAGHYHLYWGDDRAALLAEVKNWPTYYPSSFSGEQIVEAMKAH